LCCEKIEKAHKASRFALTLRTFMKL